MGLQITDDKAEAARTATHDPSGGYGLGGLRQEQKPIAALVEAARVLDLVVHRDEPADHVAQTADHRRAGVAHRARPEGRVALRCSRDLAEI